MKVNDQTKIRNLLLFNTVNVPKPEDTSENFKTFTVAYPILEELLKLHYINNEIKYIDYKTNKYQTTSITVKDIIQFCKSHKQVLVFGAVSIDTNKLISIGVICNEEHDEELRQLIWDTFENPLGAEMNEDMVYAEYEVDNDPLYENSIK